ncbi:hypothetical protein BGZ83_003395 [Gryganskiella cystojenkinii]|nr:hypothetical protein BGZ83_003395 [Gryganskiella cystojenkinii]
MFHPTRGGTRGGADQFKWEDVKEDKHRENYLGNSLLAPVGRWQKGRDLTWYAKAGKDGQDESTVQDEKKAEIQSIKDAEAEAMAAALGYKTKRKIETNVTENELKSAIGKNNAGPSNEMDEKLKELSTSQGLGFGRRAAMPLADQKEAFRSKPATKPTVKSVPLIPETALTPIGKERAERAEKPGYRRPERTEREDRGSHKHRRSSRSPSSTSRKNSSKRGHYERSQSRERSTKSTDQKESSHRRDNERRESSYMNSRDVKKPNDEDTKHRSYSPKRNRDDGMSSEKSKLSAQKSKSSSGSVREWEVIPEKKSQSSPGSRSARSIIP